MKVLIGLGNPGKKYEETRHNAGFMALDALAQKLGVKFSLKQEKFSAKIAVYGNGEKRTILVKPETYMNNSGSAVSAVMNYYKAGQEDLITIYDDKDLELGKIRTRKAGSSGGHNGMQSIIKSLKTNNVARIRIGISGPREEQDTKEHVLEKFSKKEKEQIEMAIHIVTDRILDYLDSGFKEESLKIELKK